MTNSPHARVAAASLVLGPLLFTIADLCRRLVDSGAHTATAITDAVGQHDGLWLSAGLLEVAGAFLFVPGIVGLTTAARGRGARITRVGAVLLGIGLMASVGHAVAYYSTYALYAETHLTKPDLDALDHASQPLVGVLIAMFIVGMAFGPIVLLIGLRRGRQAPMLSVFAAIAFVVLAETGSVVGGVLLILAALATFVPAARSLTGPHSDRTPQSAVSVELVHS